MEQNILVTLIVGVFNGEKYLAECLNSIINQSYQNLEIIVVDDGSTDKSAAIVKSFMQNDERIRYFYENNSGVSTARNLGIKNSNGEFIAIVDQDDVLSKIYIEYLLNLAILNSCDISTTYEINSFYGQLNQEFMTSNSNLLECDCLNGNEVAKMMLLYKLPIGPWNKLVRKKFLMIII